MSIKQNLISVITVHPKLVTFGIGPDITFVIGTAIGMVEAQQAHAFVSVCSSGYLSCSRSYHKYIAIQSDDIIDNRCQSNPFSLYNYSIINRNI